MISFIHLDYQGPGPLSRLELLLQKHSLIALSFIANFKKYTLLRNDSLLVILAVTIVLLAIGRPPALPPEKSIHKRVQLTSQAANIVKVRRFSHPTRLHSLGLILDLTY